MSQNRERNLNVRTIKHNYSELIATQYIMNQPPHLKCVQIIMSIKNTHVRGNGKDSKVT
jgi:hypothetical protein